MKVYEAKDLDILNPALIPDDARHALINAYDSISRRIILMLYDEVRLPDRKALDRAFLLALGFKDPKERNRLVAELQRATCRIIWNRLAKSDKERESKKTYDQWFATGRPFDRQAFEVLC